MIMPRPTVLQFHFVNRNGIFRNNLNNNDLRNPLIHMRDHLFHTAFVRLALVYSRLFAETERKIIEFFSLTVSFLALAILMYIHFVFVRTPTSCLENIQDRWPQDGILRVEILQKKSNEEYTLEKSYLKEKRLRQYGYDFSYLFHSDPIFREDAFRSGMKTYSYSRDKKHYSSQNDSVEENYTSDVSKLGISNNTNSDTTNAKRDLFAASEKEPEVFVWPEDEYIMEFSLEYGFLKLTPTVRKNLNITVELVTLDPTVDKCFGGFFNQFILNNFLGYDEVLLASLKFLAAKEEYKGYVRNVVTEVEFIFVNIWMDRKSYITAGFVMMVFTVSISILLRYSHHQIFVFIVELLHMLEFHSSINFPAGPLLTVILALVGMEAIMSEFFNDTAVAFYVILIVWVADQYDAICCRTALSKRHWLRFFYLYHFFFYAYSYRFGHNRFLALLTSWLFTLHSMIYFFHRYELPLLIARNAQNGNDSPPSEQDPSGSAAAMPNQEGANTAENVQDERNMHDVSDFSNSSNPTSGSTINHSSNENESAQQFKFTASMKTSPKLMCIFDNFKSFRDVKHLKSFDKTYQAEKYSTEKMFYEVLQTVLTNKICQILDDNELFLISNRKTDLFIKTKEEEKINYKTKSISYQNSNYIVVKSLFVSIFTCLLFKFPNSPINLKDNHIFPQITKEKVIFLKS